MIPTILKDAVDLPHAAYPVRTQGVPVFNTSTSFVFRGSQGPVAPVPAHWGTTPLVLPSNNNSNNNTLPPPPPTPAFRTQVATTTAGLLAISKPAAASAQGLQNVVRFGGHSAPLAAAQLAKKKEILSAGFSQHVFVTHIAIPSHQCKPPVVFGPSQVIHSFIATHPTRTNRVGSFGSAQSQYPTGAFLSLPPPVNQPTNIWAHNTGVASRAHLKQSGVGMPLNPVVPAQTNWPVFPPAPIPAPAVLAAPFLLSSWSNQQRFGLHGIVILNNNSKYATLTGVSGCLDPDELMRQMRENVAVLEERYKIMKDILVGDPEYVKKLEEWKEKIDRQ